VPIGVGTPRRFTTLNAAGTTVYKPDLRGHGGSGKRGDIDYIGQLDDDIVDLIATIRAEHVNAALTLIGFSAGGAFTIRIAGGPHGDLFNRYIVIDPAWREVYHRAGHHYHHYYNPGPIGAAAGIAGAAIGTAGAIATAPFRGAYAYDRGYGPYYGPDPYYGRGW
jgi:pimeloyl-ACP methyl ester carboxylesterase